MGLASALTTALTGLTAAETQIDVVGNNLANSQTVGFKASDAVFATQFLQTQSLGASPTGSAGGTNPRQIGLGTQVAEISPDFTQGTIEVSSSPSDLALQGDGFFIVEGSTGEQLYTRNGQFKTNAENELVTTSGNRLLGFGIDDEFRIQTTVLKPLSIPLGAAAVAQATENVFLEGTLSPTGEIATQGRVVESAILGDSAVPRPDTKNDANGNGVVDNGEEVTRATVAAIPDGSGATLADTNSGAGTHGLGATYQYRFTYVDSSGNETVSSDTRTHTVAAANSDVELDALPTNADYESVRIYRTEDGGNTFYRLADVSMADAANPYVDTVADGGLDTNTELDNSIINGNYTYVFTYYRNGEEESRPSTKVGPVNVVNGRAHLSDIPEPPVPGPGDSFPAYDEVRVYRNLSTDASSFYLVDTVGAGESFTDSKTDAEISDLDIVGNQALDQDGPKIDSNTLLVNVIRRDGLSYENQFQLGTLSFESEKGGRILATQDFEITETSTVQDLLEFMQDSLGIQDSTSDAQNPVPGSQNTILGETGILSAGASIADGKIRFVSNNGVDNGVQIGNAAFTIKTDEGEVVTPDLSFGKVQDATGESAVTDLIVYDSLGTPLNLRVTVALEERSDSTATYRWYADSANNDPVEGADISVGTGLISFDSDGNFLNASNTTVAISRRNVPAGSPLEFDLDFSNLSGLETSESSLNATGQDGFATGKLTSYIVGEDGVIRGVFTNGATRDLGQIRLARFANSAGLEQRGQNLFASGVNSGLAVQGDPGQEGIGSIIAGAVELSNSDIGRNLIDLVLATTQYRGNTRVINSAQQLLDELLNLRR